MSQTDADVLVIGAGVIGLTTATCLAETGVSVAIATAEPPQRTTSAASGAIWGPHLVGMDERVALWADVTLARFAEYSAPDIGRNALEGIVRSATGIAATREGGARGRGGGAGVRSGDGARAVRGGRGTGRLPVRLAAERGDHRDAGVPR